MIEFFFLFVLGASFGSFANVLILRVPKGESVAFPPSSCANCGKKIPFYNNIPIFSYLILRAKSSCCKEPLSPIYLVGELVGGVLFVVIYLKNGFGLDFFRVGVVFLLLYVLSLIDLKEMMIPDSISLSAALISLISLNIEVFEGFFLVAGVGVMLRFAISFLLKKEAMGEGDIIIFAILGALLGLQGAFMAIFISSLIALPIFGIVGRDARVPFVPFLALGGFVTYLFYADISRLLLGYHG